MLQHDVSNSREHHHGSSLDTMKESPVPYPHRSGFSYCVETMYRLPASSSWRPLLPTLFKHLCSTTTPRKPRSLRRFMESALEVGFCNTPSIQYILLTFFFFVDHISIPANRPDDVQSNHQHHPATPPLRSRKLTHQTSSSSHTTALPVGLEVV